MYNMHLKFFFCLYKGMFSSHKFCSKDYSHPNLSITYKTDFGGEESFFIFYFDMKRGEG